MRGRSPSTLGAILFMVALAHAEPPKELQDPFLDNFVGEWRVERKMGNGSIAQASVRGEWTLKHHFVRLHYGYADAAPEYEAFVFIGFDDSDKSYVCHWMDVFGGRYSELGHGKLDSNLLAIEFRFVPKDGELTNKFAFDPQTKTWTSLIRQTEKGEWKTFLEERWIRVGQKK
jgi:hypothetical protein